MDLLPTYLTKILRKAWTFSKWYTGAWLVYYLVCDSNRRLVIYFRASRFKSERTDRLLGSMLSSNPKGKLVMPERGPPKVSDGEKDSLRAQFAPVSFLGRYWNPFPEWREQGAWEAFAKWGISLASEFVRTGSGTEQHDSLVRGEAREGLDVEDVDWDKIFPWGKDEKDVSETDDRLMYTWIGQSTSYVLLSRLRILTDPIFTNQTAPSFSFSPYRLRPIPTNLASLGKIDLVLVSHNHYDHLEAGAVTEIGDSALWIVPSGVGAFIASCGVSKGRIVEMSWWDVEEMELPVAGGGNGNFRITCTPNMHWTARHPFNTNTTLSCSFLVESIPMPSIGFGKLLRPRSFYHVGDTGYSPTLFTAIGKVLDRQIDCASIPIGSYEPRWAMHLQHTDPEGAVRIAQHLKVKKSFAAHWGTWVMSDEHHLKPPQDLAIARTKLGFSRDMFEVLPVGRTVEVD